MGFSWNRNTCHVVIRTAALQIGCFVPPTLISVLGYCLDIVEFDLDIGEYLMTDTSLTVIALFVMFGDLIHLGKVPQVKDPDSYEKSVWQIRCIIGPIMDGQILMNYQFL